MGPLVSRVLVALVGVPVVLLIVWVLRESRRFR